MSTFARVRPQAPSTTPSAKRAGGWEAQAILAIAFRDFLKLARDPARIVATIIFPLIFIGILGTSMQANLGAVAGYDILVYTFTGVLIQTVNQSTTTGVISLMDDRENDFSQEI